MPPWDAESIKGVNIIYVVFSSIFTYSVCYDYYMLLLIIYQFLDDIHELAKFIS